MQNASNTQSPRVADSDSSQDLPPVPPAPTAADLEDRLRNFPVPELQFRLLIKSIPGLAS